MRVLINDKCIAFATSCTLHTALNLEESSTKDSTNNFAEQTPTGISWDLSCDALYSVDTDSTGVNAIGALDMVLAQTKVQVAFEQTGGEKNRVAVSGSAVYQGDAFVNEISVNSSNRQNVSYSISLTGDGPLTKTTAT